MSDTDALRTNTLIRGLSTLSQIHGIAETLDEPGEAYAQRVYTAVVASMRDALTGELRVEFDRFIPVSVHGAAERRLAEQSVMGWAQSLLAQQSPAFITMSDSWGERIVLRNDVVALRLGENPF